MQIEILININSYQTWESFFRPLFWLVTQSREAKKRPRRRSHASEAWDLEHRDVFSVRFFFYVHVFCGMPFNAKQTSYWKRLKFVPSCFFNFWSTTESQMKTATTMAPNKRLYMHARFYFFAHLSAFVRKKIRECDNQKLKVLRTQTFNRITSNSKRARTKFKLIGKFKMLRKLKQQKAFPARSLHLFAFVCKQQEK